MAMPFISSILLVAHHGCGSYNGSEVCYWHCSVFCGFCGPLCHQHHCLVARSLRGPSLVTQILPFFAHCSCFLDACYRDVVNAGYSLLQPPCILIFLSPKGSLQRWKDGAVQGQSLLQRTDVPGREGRNTDGRNRV